MPLPPYVSKTNNKLIYTAKDGEILYYIPEDYFDLSLAEIVGEYVEVMGIFCYVYIDGSGKSDHVKHFKNPTMVKCKPSKIDKIRNFRIETTPTPSDYRVLHFFTGAELLSETAVPMEIDKVEKFVNMLRQGHLPNYIPYNEIQDYMIMNAKLNDFNYQVSNQIIGMLISELYRDASDYSRPYRLTDMQDMMHYKALSIEKVPKYISAYTAITSENPDEAIASAMVNKGTEATHSPLEKIMMN